MRRSMPGGRTAGVKVSGACCACCARKRRYTRDMWLMLAVMVAALRAEVDGA